ncbi:hypothetical protein [Methylomicrobium agile]|uniref:hypothetical protein n=1 Tax=Methylomicrobium agile TaxID=39774 RepID=UPI0004DF90B6|nr:hypothetical protein [Methylomicrobium agile]
MTRHFGLVDYKVQEAEFFLLETHRHAKKLGFLNVQFCTAAFVSSARSITFAMQSCLKGHAEFDSWYAPRQEALRKDALSRFFHDFRTVTQHIGENLVSGGSHSNTGTFYYFLPCSDLPNVPEMDVITACDTYFRRVLNLVFDCYVDLRTTVDGQWYFTEEHFRSIGKTIEDAEEELGFPRGWTDIKQPDIEPYRWELLRKRADGCGIEEQFHTWLDRELERPEPLPPYFPVAK